MLGPGMRPDAASAASETPRYGAWQGLNGSRPDLSGNAMITGWTR